MNRNRRMIVNARRTQGSRLHRLQCDGRVMVLCIYSFRIPSIIYMCTGRKGVDGCQWNSWFHDVP